MNNAYINNYVEILENENKEFKRQINELQIQKDRCEYLNLNSLAIIICGITAFSLFIFLIYVLMIKKIIKFKEE